jgi:hypothetical protein
MRDTRPSRARIAAAVVFFTLPFTLYGVGSAFGSDPAPEREPYTLPREYQPDVNPRTIPVEPLPTAEPVPAPSTEESDPSYVEVEIEDDDESRFCTRRWWC